MKSTFSESIKLSVIVWLQANMAIPEYIFMYILLFKSRTHRQNSLFVNWKMKNTGSEDLGRVHSVWLMDEQQCHH